MGWRVGDIMEAQDGVLKTGTSTVGITFDGGVVVGADHRATMGHFVANKSVQKLFQIQKLTFGMLMMQENMITLDII